ncbi:MAG: hypothetical protein V3U75_13470 [Methylococcaceae bacterium]
MGDYPKTITPQKWLFPKKPLRVCTTNAVEPLNPPYGRSPGSVPPDMPKRIEELNAKIWETFEVTDEQMHVKNDTTAHGQASMRIEREG